MKDKVKTGLIISILLIVSFVAGGVVDHFFLKESPYIPPVSDHNPVKVTPITETTPTGQQYSVIVSDLQYYKSYMSFIATSNGEGKAKIEIDRPKIWEAPQRMFSLGLGGGYYCGYWLPGGSIGHYWRLGSIKETNFYVGPELSISANNKINREIPVAVSIMVKLLITY